jgi:hypothetical protein
MYGKRNMKCLRLVRATRPCRSSAQTIFV